MRCSREILVGCGQVQEAYKKAKAAAAETGQSPHLSPSQRKRCGDEAMKVRTILGRRRETW